jgi:CubicO group peptidase (beta-lactamase class C family)
VFEPLGMKDTFSVPDDRANDRRGAIAYALDDNSEYVENGGSAFDALVGSGSFYTTVTDLCLYERALRAHSLVSEASMDEAFTGGQTNDGNPTDYGFGWYLGAEDGVSFAEHEGSWNGFNSYIRYYIDEPFAVFVLANHPGLTPLDVANVAIDAYGTYS